LGILGLLLRRCCSSPRGGHKRQSSLGTPCRRTMHRPAPTSSPVTRIGIGVDSPARLAVGVTVGRVTMILVRKDSSARIRSALVPWVGRQEPTEDVCETSLVKSQRRNLYAYVDNSPLVYVDPFGLEKCRRKCLWDFYKCMVDCMVLPGFSTFLTEFGNQASFYYAAKAWAHAASRNLRYPLRSSIFRGLWRTAGLAIPAANAAAAAFCLASCASEPCRCE